MHGLRVRDRVDEFHFNSLSPNGLLSNTVTDISTTSVPFLGYLLSNPNASNVFVQVFYAPAADVTLGTTPPDTIIKMGSDGAVAWDFEEPRGKDGSGLSVAATTTATGSTAPGTGVTGTFYYKR